MALGPIRGAFVRWVVRARMTRKGPVAKDGLYAFLCGTGSPMPDIKRAGPCIAVAAGRRFFVIDAGQGSTRNALLMRLPVDRTDAVLLTHFHSDHIADLGELALQRWVRGSAETPINVVGPIGVDQVVEGFNLAYRLDAQYRVAHHGPKTVPPSGSGGIAMPFELSSEPDSSAVVFDDDDVMVTAFRVDHRPVDPAVGYRIDYKGRSLVVSGDTVYSESVLSHSQGADLLFHDALNAAIIGIVNENADLADVSSAAAVTSDILSYHAAPQDAARIAQAAGVRRLVLYHLIPPVPALMKRAFVGDATKYFKGPIDIAEDGMMFFLPPGGNDIHTRRVLR
jgi:ribonuclease Z